MNALKVGKNGLLLSVHIQPNAKKSEVVGLHGGALKIKIHAVPEDGKANEEIIKVLSKILGIAKSNITIQSGATSRKKNIALAEITYELAAARLGL
jgi:uncharacterized protein (TIGR00251 family)